MRPLLPPWGLPPHRLALEPGGVHLWRVPLAIGSTPERPPSPQPSPTEGRGSDNPAHAVSDCLPSLFRLLAPDEQARAQRLRVPEKARDFIVGRARLRQILSRYLGRAPADFAFTYGPHGKPFLAADRGSDLHFNLGHSGALMLLAISASRPVGVDLERIDPTLDFALLARRYFSPAEQNILHRTPPARRRRTFYRLWTCKEAYLKGKGGGFAAAVREDAQRLGWCTGNLFVGRNYLAAVAVQEGVASFRCWTLTLEG